MRQIVCISTSNYYPLPTSKQHIMSRLSDAEILYFDPPITHIARFKDKSAKERLKAYKTSTKVPEAKSPLTVYAMPPVLPFFNKWRWVNRRNQKKLAKFVKQKMRQHGFENPILWVYNYTAADLIQHIPHSAVIYHCVDRHSGYPSKLMNPVLVDDMDADLCKQADLVLVTAAGLRTRLAPLCRDLRLMPNGVDFDRFHSTEPLPVPDDMAAIPRPIFGFSGAIQEWIDIGLIAHTAKARPDWSFAFASWTLPGVDDSVLKGLPNIHMLGRKPFADVPQYVNAFDVCLHPGHDNELSRDVSPLKFYEYLATGKPIVSTPQPQQVQQYADIIHIAITPDEFVTACENALQDDGKAELRVDAARQCSWASRVAMIEDILTASGL
ncbi:MAG: glycosyltransferase [Oscillospiraceae bacterium]|nr:glycosyltransferase [Oscillospiraceae bacterium]